MKEHYCVHGVLTPEEHETAVGKWYAFGMLGSEEEALSDATIGVRVYFAAADAAEAAANDLRCNIRRNDTIAVRTIFDEDWNARWRQSMEPARLAPSWWVAPLWLPPPMMPNEHWIKIEPKMAFGTGHHETTRLAARAFIACKAPLDGASVLDIGTGSGVLCFVAALSGASRCIGIDIDRNCRGNLAENRSLNAATGCSFIIGTIDALKSGAAFDMIVMNMIHTESAPLLADCRTLLAGKGVLVWSGILSEEKKRAIEAAGSAGFVLVDELYENEWWCGRFIKGAEGYPIGDRIE